MELQKVLKEQLELIKPPAEVCGGIEKVSKEFCSELKEKLKKKKIKAEVFVGGSLAKGTLVKKKIYDVDVFVRFDMSYKDEEVSGLLGRVLGEKILGKEVKKVHGSRDYYQVVDGVLIEVIPVLKIKKPEQAVNVTDLSYFHVNYVLGEIKKNKKLVDEIRLAKTFVHGQDAYGAESYIHGFSGYALELLICHYGSFLKFVKAVAEFRETESNDGKIVIDDGKYYKNKEDVLIDMNKSKIVGPIVLIDPTFKERNASSSLSKSTFYDFQNACKDFLKAPSGEFFEVKAAGSEFEGLKDVKVISVKTNKQAGDIAGTKSKKFFDFFVYQLRKEFDIKKSGFEYDDVSNAAKFYFVVGQKKAEVVKGPPVTNVHNLTKFKKAHPSAYVKGGFAYYKRSYDVSFYKWFSEFLKSEKKVMKGMGVKKVGVEN